MDYQWEGLSFIKNEIDGEKQVFDYAACNYPQGLDMENTLYFNEENIDEVVFEGYMDDDEKRFQKLFKEWMEENKDIIKKVPVNNTYIPKRYEGLCIQ